MKPLLDDANLRWNVAQDVLWSVHPEGILLFQTSTGKLFVGSPREAETWALIASGEKLGKVAGTVASRFLARAESLGLISQSKPRKAPGRWLAFRAWVSLAVYDLGYRVAGFRSVSWQVGHAFAPEAGTDEPIVSRVIEAVDLAACFYFKPVRCLQRSAVIVRLLRRQGISGRLVIGWRPSPFMAHAWVEVGGRIVGDAAGYPRRLKVFHTF
jgi:hypothetical protein